MRSLFALLAALLASSAIAAPIPPGMMPCAGCGAIQGQLRANFANTFFAKTDPEIAGGSWCRVFEHVVFDGKKHMGYAQVAICNHRTELREFRMLSIQPDSKHPSAAPKIEAFFRNTANKERNDLPKKIEHVVVGKLMVAGDPFEDPLYETGLLLSVPRIEEKGTQKTIAPVERAE